ncbi:MAG TPA: response regulator transcription factor [Chryseosolibacter sp.]|nr:response regulator transcription factor [Chryseosolibacter sp.]
MNTRSFTTLAIADDHLLVVNGLKAMLQKDPDISILFAATSGAELLEQLTIAQPDVLLLDIQMPDMNGIDLCKVIHKNYPGVRIIALTNFEQSSYVKQMMRNGATGYLLKNIDVKTLKQAIDSVMENKTFVQDQVKNNLMGEMLMGKKQTSQGISLTKREVEILSLVAREMTNQEIADKLFISIRTVETHRINLTQKLGVHNTAGLVKEAYRRGLV